MIDASHAVTLDLYLPFVLACFAVLGVPGPTILLVVAYNIANGRRAVLWTTAGVVAGDAIAAAVVIAGLSTVMASVPHMFVILKWVGVAYLVYLAITMLRSARAAGDAARSKTDAVRDLTGPAMLRQCLAVTALNAKGLVFMSAFFPGFIGADAPRLPQLILLGVTFVVLGGLNAAIWGFFAGRASDLFQRPGYRMGLNIVGGLFLLLAAATVALTRLSVP